MRSMNKKRLGLRDRARRRVVTGTSVALALVLAALAAFFLNALSWRLPRSWELEVRARHQLSEKTHVMLEGLEGQVEVIAVVDPDARLFDEVRALLLEYQHAAQSLDGLKLQLEWVNPDRDISRTRRLADAYDLDSGNQVIFRSGENYRVLSVGDLARYEYELRESGLARQMVGFLGEQAFSSAILAVVSGKAPVVYFLTGHGERDIDDFSEDRGYSSLARAISQDHFDVRRLPIGDHGGIPDDCDILVIAGPRERLAEEEVSWISEYLLQRRGRVMLLLDSGVETGLEGLLEQWHVHAGKGYVTGRQIPGWDLVVNEYGDHAITRPLRNVTTAYVTPRPLYPLREAGTEVRAEDQVRLRVLARGDENSWVEREDAEQLAAFEDGVDEQGAVPVAIAGELGPTSPDAQLDTTRLVVIGDSHFVSNAAISGGVGGNVTFFMSALNWLGDRDTLIAIAPNVPFALQMGLTRHQWRRISLFVIFILPGGVALFGGIVGYRRKR